MGERNSGTVVGQHLSLDSPEILQLTHEIQSLKQTFLSTSSDMVAAIGERLLQAKAKLIHGDWQDWLRDQIHLPARTAQQYMSVAILANQHPELFADLKELGPAKLYRLAVLDEQTLNQVLDSEYFVVPGTQCQKTLAELSFIELHQVIQALQGKPAFDPHRAVQRLGRRLRTMDREIGELTSHIDELNAAEIQALADQLEGLLERLRQPLQLEESHHEVLPPADPAPVPLEPDQAMDHDDGSSPTGTPPLPPEPGMPPEPDQVMDSATGASPTGPGAPPPQSDMPLGPAP